MLEAISSQKRAILLAFSSAAAFAFSCLMSNWGSVFGLVSIDVDSLVLHNTMVFLVQATCIAFLAVALAAPLAWLIPQRPMLIACGLSLGTLVPATWSAFLFSDPLTTAFGFASFGVFFASCWVAAVLVDRLRGRAEPHDA
jgi:hypothetical protein